MKPHRLAAPARSDRQLRRRPHRRGVCLPNATAAERLEARRLLSFSQVGPQFVVHNYIPDDQYRPAVAADAAGDFVVSYEFGPPGPATDIEVRRFAGGDGEPYEGEFSVNTTVPRQPFDTDVAMDADGDFVVTWAYYTKNGNKSDSEIYARRFDAAGKPQGGEFRVNQITKGYQSDAVVAMDASGDFVIAWYTSSYDVAHDGIRARRYAADGTPLGDEFKVSVYSRQSQDETAVAMDADGDFVIVWRSRQQDFATTQGIYGRRYDRFGNPLPVPSGVPAGEGGEFRVNKTTAGDQLHPDIAMDMAGEFVVVWTSYDAANTYNETDTFMQRFTAAGALAGGEVRINDSTTKSQNQPHVAMDADGDFLVAWQTYFSYGDGPYIYGKRYRADGTVLPKAENAPPGGTGGEFRVGTLKQEAYPDVTLNAAGDAVIVWGAVGRTATASGWDVWAQRYDESTDPAGPIVSGVSGSGQLVVSGKPLTQPVSDLVVMFSEALDITEGGGGYSPLDSWNYRLSRDGVDVSSLVTGVAYAHNPQTNKFETKLTLSAPLPNGSYVLTVREVLRDLAGNTLDGNLDGRPGGVDAAVPFVVHVAPPPVLQSITVNGDGSAAQRSQVRSLTLNFDQPVNLAAGAVRLELFNTDGSGANDGSDPTNISSALAAPTSPDGGKTWVFTFAATSAFVEKTPGGASTGSLVDGVYSIDVDPAKVMGDGIVMAVPASLTFHRLFGDLDGSKSVNTLDFGLFRSALGKSTGQAGFDAAFDFDGNGSVNTLDFGQFRNRYGKSFTY